MRAACHVLLVHLALITIIIQRKDTNNDGLCFGILCILSVQPHTKLKFHIFSLLDKKIEYLKDHNGTFSDLFCSEFNNAYIYMGERNGKLPLRTCSGCSVPEPYRSPDWALVPAQIIPRTEY